MLEALGEAAAKMKAELKAKRRREKEERRKKKEEERKIKEDLKESQRASHGKLHKVRLTLVHTLCTPSSCLQRTNVHTHLQPSVSVMRVLSLRVYLTHAQQASSAVLAPLQPSEPGPPLRLSAVSASMHWLCAHRASSQVGLFRISGTSANVRSIFRSFAKGAHQ